MKDAFSKVYGRYHSPWSRVFGPALTLQTYLRALHLLLMFPLGIGYFVALVTALAIGGAMIWTIVGALVLIPTLFFVRWAGDAEAWVVRRVTQIELRRPPTTIDFGGPANRDRASRVSLRTQVWTRIIDPSTWTGLVYLFGQFPIGVAAFVMIVTVYASVGMLVSAPIIIAAGGDVELRHGFDSPLQGLAFVPFGVLLFFLGAHAVCAASASHAVWARIMLGSRAKTVPHMPIVEGTTTGPEGGPGIPAAQAEFVAEERRTGALPDAIETLTGREKEVLALIARGYSNAEIAEAFIVSEGTVKTHVKSVLAKLGLRDRTQATSFAYETGFVLPQRAEGEGGPIPIARRRLGG